MRQRDLEILLQEVPPHPEPDPRLEQVPTPADLAARTLFSARNLGDIEGRRVLDLGCGTGTLAIGASLLGASEVHGVDVDAESVAVAREVAQELGADVTFHVEDVRDVDVPADTVLMNPPFGAQRRGADRPFLKTALRSAPVTYSFHLAETRDFVERFVGELGGEVSHAWAVRFPVPRTFRHHEEAERVVDVVLLRTTT